MTEEEAKTKWCPYARVLEVGDGAHEHDAPFNRIDCCDANPDNPCTDSVPDVPELLLLPTTLCIGSACMAWRTVYPCYPIGMTLPADAGEPHGYCGLGGKP